MSTRIREIIYEEVNSEYGWGKYGEFRVLIRKRDGYINATKLCKDGGKEYRKWSETKSSKELIEETSSVAGIPATLLIQEVTLGEYILRGTYVHPDLIPHIASWVSPKFAIMVSRIVNSFIIKEYQEEIYKRDVELGKRQEKIYELLDEMKDLKDEVKDLKQSNHLLHQKLDLANENIIEAVRGVGQANTSIRGVQTCLARTSRHSVPPEHVHRKDEETYAIYYITQDEKEAHYIQCRARPHHLRRREKELQEKFNQFRIVLAIHPVPNARTLASEFERRIQEQGATVDQRYQEISLPLNGPLTEELMSALAREIFEERTDPAAQSEEKYSPVSLAVEDGKIFIEEKELAAPTEPTYDERFSELFKKSAAELKELARTFPRDLKTFGGFSGKNKTDLVHWILSRQGYTPLK